MTRTSMAWTLAGLVTAVVGLSGVSSMAMRGAPAVEAGWMPPCSRSLGPEYTDLDATVVGAERPPGTLLVGVDWSPSNRAQASEQLLAATEFVADRPIDASVGILFVSDRSDRSSTPDLIIEPAAGARVARAPDLPCGECVATSLFEQQCVEQIRAALDVRVDAVAKELEIERAGAAQARRVRIEGWRREVSDYRPKPGTSIVRFWRKVSGLPTVRRNPGGTTVVLLSDLQEAATPERRAFERFVRRVNRSGDTCDVGPDGIRLDGVKVVLLQTITDGIDPERWGRRWEVFLECAGAQVTRYRYSPSVGFGEYLREGSTTGS